MAKRKDLIEINKTVIGAALVFLAMVTLVLSFPI